MRLFSKIVRLIHAQRVGITLARSTKIDPFAVLSLKHGGTITIGERTSIGLGAIIAPYGGSVRIGSDSSVNPYSVLYGHGGLEIGNYVRIAAHTVIIPANHGFGDRDKPIAKQPLDAKGVIIEDDVWIGTGVSILDGVKIANGSVIGAGSVVTRSTEPYGIYVGNPARLVKFR